MRPAAALLNWPHFLPFVLLALIGRQIQQEQEDEAGHSRRSRGEGGALDGGEVLSEGGALDAEGALSEGEELGEAANAKSAVDVRVRRNERKKECI